MKGFRGWLWSCAPPALGVLRGCAGRDCGTLSMGNAVKQRGHKVQPPGCAQTLPKPYWGLLWCCWCPAGLTSEPKTTLLYRSLCPPWLTDRAEHCPSLGKLTSQGGQNPVGFPLSFLFVCFVFVLFLLKHLCLQIWHLSPAFLCAQCRGEPWQSSPAQLWECPLL